MAADTIISGVVRGVLPYAALAAVGIVGYSYLNRHGYLDGVKSAADAVANIPSQIVNTIRSRTGADKFADGDFIGGAQQIVRNIPVVAAGEAAFNVVKDNLPEVELPDPPQVTQENTGISESVWTDTPLKYVPAVAIRNGITKLFGR